MQDNCITQVRHAIQEGSFNPTAHLGLLQYLTQLPKRTDISRERKAKCHNRAIQLLNAHLKLAQRPD